MERRGRSAAGMDPSASALDGPGSAFECAADAVALRREASSNSGYRRDDARSERHARRVSSGPAGDCARTSLGNRSRENGTKVQKTVDEEEQRDLACGG